MKAEYKTLDWIFKHEEKLKEAVEKIKCQEISMFNNSHLRDPTAANALRTLVMVNSVKIERKHINSPDKWLEIISNTYEIAKSKNANICEIAERRYHMGEYSTTTRFEKCLSKKNYWQMISIFLEDVFIND